jgi:hypothetical protein
VSVHTLPRHAGSGADLMKRCAGKLRTAGQVIELKLVKRQGYGRARADLMRKRLLRAA